MSLAVVRNIGSATALRSDAEIAGFEQEIVDQYALAMAAAGLTDAACRRDTAGDLAVPRLVGGAVVDGVV